MGWRKWKGEEKVKWEEMAVNEKEKDENDGEEERGILTTKRNEGRGGV